MVFLSIHSDVISIDDYESGNGEIGGKIFNIGVQS